MWAVGGGAMPVVAIHMHRWSVWNVFLNILPLLQPFNVCSLGRTSAPSVKSAPVRNAPSPLQPTHYLQKLNTVRSLSSANILKKGKRHFYGIRCWSARVRSEHDARTVQTSRKREGASALSQTHPFFENPPMMPSFFRSAIPFWYHLYSIILTMPTNTPRITTFVPCLLPVFFFIVGYS